MGNHLRWVTRFGIWILVALFVAPLAFETSPTQAAGVKKSGTPTHRPGTARKGEKIAFTVLEVKKLSGGHTKWGTKHTITGRQVLLFRWRTNLANITGARWQLYRKRGTGTRIHKQGTVSFVPKPNKFGTFKVHFSGLGVNTYYIRIRPIKTSRRRGKRRTIRLNPSNPVRIVFAKPGGVTKFTTAGLNPRLYNRMRIAIDLKTLKLRGSGGDEDPYLMIAVIYADGTTVVPYVDWSVTPKVIHFPSSTLRIDSPTKTHENVPGGDPGDNLKIPASTGHFEKVIKPIGMKLARQLGLSQKQIKKLREGTQVAIVVIGFEEDAVPSTGIVDKARAMFVRRLREELEGIIRGLRITAEPGKAPKLPNLQDVVGELRKKLKKELTDFVTAEGIEEALIKIGSIPGWALLPGALNQDDYIGHGRAIFSYQQILDAGTRGIPFSMRLDQNCKCNKPWYIQKKRTEDIYYRIVGRIRLKM